jgi:ribonucleoside-triphosphate reductase
VIANTYQPTVRAQVITRRTYNRPVNEEGTRFERWSDTMDRVIDHQRWLWERAINRPLDAAQEAELGELRELGMARKSLVAGRTLWLGGTEVVRRRESANFNCSFTEVRTVHDVVDIFWLLLQGCGTGFKPISGTLSGFTRRMEVKVIRSVRSGKDGDQANRETFDPDTREWTIRIGDSAEAWAKSIGKILAGKFPAKTIVIDLSQIRPPGSRLRGYGWICSGDRALSVALAAICEIMNRRAGKLLSKTDIWDIVNWLGTVLSSRRSAQIGLIEYGDGEWRDVAERKPKGFDSGPEWYKSQSNNSIVFKDKPTTRQIRDIFDMMVSNGGGEPGFVNAAEATRRAPWWKGLNPCGEVLLGGFCNLTETDISKFKNDHVGLHRALRIISRANYRQTVVNLNDGILQSHWHQQNEFLRLCGVGLCGIANRPDFTPYDFRQARYSAIEGAYSMADELGLERPKNTTVIKPGGTIPKCMDTTEGATKPLGRYILNNVSFSRHDPSVPMLVDAGYRVFDNPNDPESIIATLPVAYHGVDFGGGDFNKETAVEQLERYRMLQDSYVDQNTSITISYDPSEVKDMVKWFDRNWDSYVGVSFLFRNDPTKTAEELGFSYLPQNVVTRDDYDDYVAGLRPIDLESSEGIVSEIEDDCATGACPVR